MPRLGAIMAAQLEVGRAAGSEDQVEGSARKSPPPQPQERRFMARECQGGGARWQWRCQGNVGKR